MLLAQSLLARVSNTFLGDQKDSNGITYKVVEEFFNNPPTHSQRPL